MSASPARGHAPATPVVTLALVLALSWLFAWQLALGDAASARAVYAFGMIPALLSSHGALAPELAVLPPPWTLLSALFLHPGWLALGANLVYLWLFGRVVEGACGQRRFAGLFLACGVFAALTEAAAVPLSTEPVVGAGGAVSGVLGSYLMLHPRGRVGLRPAPAIALPAVAPIAAWFALQLAVGLLGGAGPRGPAWFAHLGAFVAGALLIVFLKRRDVALFDLPPGRARLRSGA